jgi:hypothetical protein
MDELCVEKELNLAFLEMSNELLLECNQAESFLYQWMELLEQNYDFSPLYISSPSMMGQKFYASDSATEKLCSGYSLKDVEDYDSRVEGYLCFPLDIQGDDYWAVPESLKMNPVFSCVKEYFPFYYQQIRKVDTLARKLRLARFNLDMAKTVEESGDIRALLDTFLEGSVKDHAFLYLVEEDTHIAGEETSSILKEHKKAFDGILSSVVYDREHFTAESFQENVKGLILYPVYSTEDIFAVFGCFSNHRPVITNLELSYVCDFCCNQKHVELMQKEQP